MTREAQKIKTSIKLKTQWREGEKKNTAKEHSEHEKYINLCQEQKTPWGHSPLLILSQAALYQQEEN